MRLRTLISGVAIISELAFSAGPIPPAPFYSVQFTNSEMLSKADSKFQYVYSRKSASGEPGIATYFNQSGIMKNAQPGKARIEYDPFLCQDRLKTIIQGSSPDFSLVQQPNCPRRLRGVLLEEERTNFISESENFGLWDRQPAILAINEIPSASPKGNAAFEISLGVTQQNIATISRTITLAEVSPIAVSLFVHDIHPALVPRGGELPPPLFRIIISDSNGNKIAQSGEIDVRHQFLDPGDFKPKKYPNSYFYGGVTPVTANWSRVWLTLKNPISTHLKMGIQLIRPDASRKQQLRIWGAQVENGNFPTSYIPTSGQIATRYGDQLSMIPLKASNFPEQDGNFLIEADASYVEKRAAYTAEFKYTKNSRQVIFIENSAAVHYLYAPFTGEVRYGNEEEDIPIRSDGTTMTHPYSGLVNHLEPFKLSLDFKGATPGHKATVRTSLNGGLTHSPKVQPALLPSGLSEISLGGSKQVADRALNGHILRIQLRKSLPDDASGQSLVSALGFKEQALMTRFGPPSNGSWQAIPSLTEECNVPRSHPNGLDSKFNVQKDYSGNPAVVSDRVDANVEASPSDAPGYCVFRTKHDPTRKSPHYEWTTGSMTSKASQTYGYFESWFLVRGKLKTIVGEDGISRNSRFDPWLNNAFWLMSFGPTRSKDPKAIDFEIDVNEGHFPDVVNPSIHNHRNLLMPEYVDPQTDKTYASYETHNVSHGRWFTPKEAVLHPAGMNGRLDKAHSYSIEWNEQEVIWYLDNRIIRRTPNFYLHRPAFVWWSSAILGGFDPIYQGLNDQDVPAALDIPIHHIRTYKRLSQ